MHDTNSFNDYFVHVCYSLVFFSSLWYNSCHRQFWLIRKFFEQTNLLLEEIYEQNFGRLMHVLCNKRDRGLDANQQKFTQEKIIGKSVCV